MALGATPGNLARLLLRESGVLVAAGIVFGIGLALAAGRAAAAAALLFRVTPSDPATLAAAVMVLGVSAVAACYVPARRAARIEPVAALRAD